MNDELDQLKQSISQLHGETGRLRMMLSDSTDQQELLKNRADDLAVDVAILKAEMVGMQHLCAVLAKTIVELSKDDKRMMDMLLAAEYFMLHSEDVGANLGPHYVRIQLEEWIKAGIDPMVLMLLMGRQFEEAGPDRREAAREWIAQASEDELTDDTRELLERIKSQSRPK